MLCTSCPVLNVFESAGADVPSPLGDAEFSVNAVNLCYLSLGNRFKI